MNSNYSSGHFFFAPYGCCVPTDSYAWIIITLFIFFVIVLLFCIGATATVRWMYKRRMRKRLFDLKTRYINDQIAAQEFDVKLNILAQKNSAAKNTYIKSKEESKPPTMIIMDPAKSYATSTNLKTNHLANIAQARSPMETQTPIAQSTLASISTTHISSKLHEGPEEAGKQKKQGSVGGSATVAQQAKKLEIAPQPVNLPVVTTAVPVVTENAYEDAAQPKVVHLAEPPLNLVESDQKQAGLQPPTIATTISTNNSINSFSKANTSPMDRAFQDPNKLRISSLSSSTKSSGNKKKEMFGEIAARDESVPREDAGRDFILNNLPSRSWLFDSTGSSLHTVSNSKHSVARSDKTNTLFKTDSSLYTTASSEKFGHGAFVFEKK